MPNIEELEEGIEYTPSDDGELIHQLRDKVRAQAKRLRSLEQYSHICEQRIQELSPNHSFPVTTEHLGTTASSNQELHLAKQKISRLEEQLAHQQVSYTGQLPSPNKVNAAQAKELYSSLHAQYTQAVKDRADLEESLRAEVLVNEEQATYIEVLKQTIEAKMESLGITSSNVEGFSDLVQAKSSFEEKRKDYSRLQKRVADQEGTINILNDKIKRLNKEYENLIKERDQSDAHMREAAEALQYAEEEMQKIEHEKESLIEYVDEHDKIENDLREENNSLCKQLEELRSDYKELSEMHTNLEKKNSETTKELEDTRQEYSRSDRSLCEVQKSFVNAKNRVEERDREITQLKAELSALRNKSESMQANSASLSNTLRETQFELDSVSGSLNSLQKDYNNLKNQHDFTKEELEKTRKEKLEGQNISEDFRRNLDAAHSEIDNLKSKNYELELRIDQLQQDNQQAWDTQEETYRREQLQIKTNSELRTQLSQIQSDNEDLRRNLNTLNRDFNEQKSQLENKAQENYQLSRERDQLSHELKNLEQKYVFQQNQTNCTKDENVSLKEKIESINHALAVANESYRDIENQLQMTKYQLQDSQEATKRSERDLDLERQETKKYLQQVKLKESRIEDLNQSLDQKNKDTKNCFGTITSSLKRIKEEVGQVSRRLEEASRKCSSSLEFSAKDIEQWISALAEEFLDSLRNKSELSRKLSSIQQETSYLQNQVEQSSIQESSFKDREKQLRAQLDSLCAENQQTRETLNGKIYSLQNQVTALRKQTQELNEENLELNRQLKTASYESTNWRHTAESDVFTIKSLEDRVNFLIREKNELETVITRLQGMIPNPSLQKVLFELLRLRGELDLVEREKMRLNNQYLRLEADYSKSYDEELRLELGTLQSQINECENQGLVIQRKIKSTDEEIRDIQNDERRRSYDRVPTSDKRYNPSFDSYINSPEYSETPTRLKNKYN